MPSVTRIASKHLGSVTAISLTPATAAVAGQPLLVAVSLGTNSVAVASVSDSAGNAYTSIADSATNSGGPRLLVYACASPAALTTTATVTVTMSAGTNVSVALEQFSSGMSVSVDGTWTVASSSATNQNTATAAATPVTAGDNVYAVFGTFGSTAPSTPTGWSSNGYVNGGPTLLPAYDLDTGSTSVAPSTSWSGGGEAWTALSIPFQGTATTAVASTASADLDLTSAEVGTVASTASADLDLTSAEVGTVASTTSAGVGINAVATASPIVSAQATASGALTGSSVWSSPSQAQAGTLVAGSASAVLSTATASAVSLAGASAGHALLTASTSALLSLLAVPAPRATSLVGASISASCSATAHQVSTYAVAATVAVTSAAVISFSPQATSAAVRAAGSVSPTPTTTVFAQLLAGAKNAGSFRGSALASLAATARASAWGGGASVQHVNAAGTVSGEAPATVGAALGLAGGELLSITDLVLKGVISLQETTPAIVTGLTVVDSLQVANLLTSTAASSAANEVVVGAHAPQDAALAVFCALAVLQSIQGATTEISFTQAEIAVGSFAGRGDAQARGALSVGSMPLTPMTVSQAEIVLVGGAWATVFPFFGRSRLATSRATRPADRTPGRMATPEGARPMEPVSGRLAAPSVRNLDLA